MESDLNNNVHLKAWVSALNNAIVGAYKKIGRYRIADIKNKIESMEQTYIIESDADIDAYNAQIDIFTDQMERITACIDADMSDHSNKYGICALFHGNEVVSKNGGLVALLSCANYPQHLYYDYYDDDAAAGPCDCTCSFSVVCPLHSPPPVVLSRSHARRIIVCYY